VPGTPVLQVVAVEKRFGGLVANHDVSLEAASGEILAVIGPNGAGKSTLFNMLSGVTPPTAGRISLRGTDITRRGARAIAGLGLGRTFQHAKLTPDMTVLENIALGAYRLGRAGLFACLVRADRREDHATLSEARRLAALCGLGDQVALRAASLPLGSRRLVEVARALAGQPKLLLLDEPAAGLRAPEKAQLAALLADLRATGLAILLVEHDMEFVMGLADRIVVMNFGEIIARGSPAAVQTDPSVIAAYLGVPA
jgi:branched-chain amino acid transport system permease protein